MKFTFHVPTQSFGFLEIQGVKKDLPEMENLYNRYAEKEVDFTEGAYRELTTFTGEKIRYNDKKHSYEDLNGNKLISGSQYSGSLKPAFDKEKMLPLVSKKTSVPAYLIDEMWTANAQISTTFGNALHYTMKQWFLHKEHGTENNYHLPKHPILKAIVESFPEKDSDTIPEEFVSSVKDKMVGQIDGIQITGEKQCYLVDYKTDAAIDKNLEYHFQQLSFYAFILQQHGWEVLGLKVWNYTDKWECYESEVLELKKTI